MKRDNIIYEIKEKNLTQLQKIQQNVFNSTTNYDKVSLFIKNQRIIKISMY